MSRLTRPLEWDVSGQRAVAASPVGLLYEIIVFRSPSWPLPARLDVRGCGIEPDISFHQDMEAAQEAASELHERRVRAALVDDEEVGSAA